MAWWWHRQGLDKTGGSPAQVLATTGWARSVGGANPYLSLFARAGGSPQKLAALAQITRGSFTAALDHILLVAAVIAFCCALLSLVLIRQKDFVHQGHEPAPGAAAG